MAERIDGVVGPRWRLFSTWEQAFEEYRYHYNMGHVKPLPVPGSRFYPVNDEDAVASISSQLSGTTL